MRGFTAIVLLPHLLLVLAYSKGPGYQLCSQKIENCSGNSCNQSIPCLHGNCDESGFCECELCWEGDHCDGYVDRYPPVFPEAQQRVVISDPWIAETIFIAKAYDGDLGSTCPLESIICDCADIRYEVQSGNDQGLFSINNFTGEISLVDPHRLTPGQSHSLLITAHGGQEWQEVVSSGSTMELKVAVEDIHSHLSADLQENIAPWLNDEVLIRGKRSAESENYKTEFNFTLLSGEVETMEMGKRLDYRLEIMVPQTNAMDLTVELFTKDVGNGNYTPVLALFNVEIEALPSGLSILKPNLPHTEMLLSEEINTAYDRAILTFGEVKNSNDGPVPIVLYFSVTQIKNPNTVFDSKYLVTAGAEYDKETYVWVGQSEVTVHNSTDDRRIEVEILGPREIPLDSAGVYTMRCYVAVRSDIFSMEINVPEETELITVGNLGVKDFDKNYDPVPQSIYFYNTTMKGSVDDMLYTMAHIDLGIMTNVGEYENPRDDGNIIDLTFAIYALLNASNIGKEVDFSASVVVGKEKFLTESVSVKLIERVEADKMVTARTTQGELTTKDASIGDMAIYTLWSNLTNSGYADFVMEVTVPRDNKGLPRLEACSARLWDFNGSFDIPYMNTTFIDPEIKDGKFIFTFHRVHVTEQRTPSIYNDSMMYIHLVVKVSSLPTNKEDSKLTPEISIGTDGKATQKVKVDGIIIHKKREMETPKMSVTNAGDWTPLYVGGAIVLNITMAIPRAHGYAEVLMEASGENNPPLPAVHICRAELSDVGRNVPCLRMHQAEVNANFTKYQMTDPKTRTKPDMTSMMIGDVGTVPADGKNHVTVSLVVELPEGTIVKDGEQYPVSAGLLISQQSIWAATANYTMMKGPPPELPEEKWPTARAEYKDEGVVPGHLAEVEIFVRTKIQSISTYSIEVEGTTKDVSLCGLKVKSFGRNTPCVDPRTEPYYQPHDNPLDGNKISGLKFSALSNIGFRENEEHDTLSAIALVRISPSCRKSKAELKWRVVYGGGKSEGDLDITVIQGADSRDMSIMAKEPKALRFKSAYPNVAVAIGSPVVVDLEVSLVPGSLAPVMVALKNADSNKPKHPYDMCLGGIWFRGRNYPCFSPIQVESNFSSSDPEGARNDSATYNLGLVCNTFVDSKEEENKVIVRMAMRPVDDGTLKIKDSFTVDGYATVGTQTKKIDSVKFSLSREPDMVESKKENATLKLVMPSAVPIRIHQRQWIPFNITIPPDAILKVEAEARAPLMNGRAVLTVHNMRLVSGGINIPCPMRYPQPKVVFNPIVKTTQSDVINAFVGYFTNLGLSHKMNLAVPGDDDLTLEVEVEMSDHPDTKHNAQFPLTLGAHVGQSNLSAQQLIEVFRDGSERADLDVAVKVDNNKIYQSGDRIEVFVNVKHTNASQAEPVNATVRMYLPPYVEFDKVIFNNATVVGDVLFNTDKGGLDIVFPQFLFSDSASIIVGLLADPKYQRGFGRGEVNATTPYRILCRQIFHEEPTPNPPSADTVINCGPLDYITYIVNSAECYGSLGLSNPSKIYKCQISASSAAKKETGPAKIRPGGKKAWSPALRLGPYKPFLQVDFMRPTRVSRLEFFKTEDTRPIVKYRLQYSHTGSDWLYANGITELVYKGVKATDTLEEPVQTRFARVIVEEAEKGFEDSKYIGVKMEMYGCHVAEKPPSVTCSKHDPTWYSDDKTQYARHFSIDTLKDIAYFCDLEYDMQNLVCFSSTDAGNSWRTLPRSIGSLLGYDKKIGRTYAVDKRKRAYIASDDGVSWVAVDDMEVNTTMTKKSFYWSQPVPAFTTDDIEALDARAGKWRATFQGLMYDGKADPRVTWSNCCKMTK